MAFVESIRRDFGNALHSADHFLTDGVVPVQQVQQLVIVRSAGVVLTHVDFLPDDALLLLNCFGSEVRRRNEMKQHPQVLFKPVSAVKVITGYIG